MDPRKKVFEQIKDRLTQAQEKNLTERLGESQRSGDSAGEKEEYAHMMKNRLDKLNAEILAVEAAVLDAERSIQENLGNRVEKLRKIAADGYQRLDRTRQVKDDSWEALKGENELIWQNLEQSIEEARKSLYANKIPGEQ